MATGRTLRLIPYRMGDESAFQPRADFLEDMEAGPWDWRQGLPPGRRYSLVRWDGEVAGVAGIGRAAGEWQAWAILSDLSNKDFVHALWLAERAIVRFLQTEKASLGSFVRASNDGAARCLERLAFDYAGEARVGALRFLKFERRA